MAKRHMKRWSTSLVIREMQIKIRISPRTCQNGFHQKGYTYKCWRRCGEKGTLVHCGWECKLVQPLWEITKTELQCDAAILFLNVCVHVHTKWHIKIFYSGFIYNSSKLETTQLSISSRMGKLQYIHIMDYSAWNKFFVLMNFWYTQ